MYANQYAKYIISKLLVNSREEFHDDAHAKPESYSIDMLKDLFKITFQQSHFSLYSQTYLSHRIPAGIPC